jgi:predicted nucleic acid-binding protein
MILDINALSAWADGHPGAEGLLRKATRLVIPSVVLGEYLFGILHSRYRKRYEEWLSENLPSTDLAVIGYATAKAYAGIRLELKRKATPIPANDVWILLGSILFLSRAMTGTLMSFPISSGYRSEN